MIPLELLSLFLSSSFLLAITPGPDNLYVLTQSALHNRQVGVSIMLGLCSGLILHSLAIALGLSVIIIASPLAFRTVQLAGAAYLAYLAWRSFKATAADLNTNAAPTLSIKQFYWRGLLMNISNPKIALFFLAFLPQFIDITQPNMMLQTLQVGGLFILVTLVVFSIIILLSVPIRQWLRDKPQRQIVMNKLTGVVLLALAIHIAFFSG